MRAFLLHLCIYTNKVVEHEIDYLTFPDEKILERFRHEWVMAPTARPRVPVFSKSKLPRAGMPEEERARLCSLYFRPWSLCSSVVAPPHVPHLLQLPLYPEPTVCFRAPQKRKATQAESAPSWASSWARYIRGNVVSEHAAGLITRFLSMTLARSSGDGVDSDKDDEPENDGADGHAASAVNLSLSELHNVLDFASTEDGEQTKLSTKHMRSIHNARARWSREAQDMTEGLDTSGDRPTLRIDDYKKASNKAGKACDEQAVHIRHCVHICSLSCPHLGGCMRFGGRMHAACVLCVCFLGGGGAISYFLV